MRSLQEIEKETDKATEKARKARVRPYIATCDNDKGVFKAPIIGYYVPIGWSPTRRFFVDNSGLGAEDESALTASQFLSKVEAGKGYAITEIGQFQVYIQEFIRSY